jgi:hypothetical protein
LRLCIPESGFPLILRSTAIVIRLAVLLSTANAVQRAQGYSGECRQSGASAPRALLSDESLELYSVR